MLYNRPKYTNCFLYLTFIKKINVIRDNSIQENTETNGFFGVIKMLLNIWINTR
jgi:hypothetical protein